MGHRNKTEQKKEEEEVVEEKGAEILIRLSLQVNRMKKLDFTCKK